MKVFIDTQRQNWWDAYSETMCQQLLQLVTVIQEHLRKTEDLWNVLDEDVQRCKNGVQQQIESACVLLLHAVFQPVTKLKVYFF